MSEKNDREILSLSLFKLSDILPDIGKLCANYFADMLQGSHK